MPGEKKIKFENGDDSQENLSSDSEEELRSNNSEHASAAEGDLNETG
jgi:hypothetical protein